jgi:hypothetical protein
MDNENDQLAALLLYRESLKRNLTMPPKFSGGFPRYSEQNIFSQNVPIIFRMRHGRIGSQWRHIKQTNTYSGSNLMFIDGTVRLDDSIKYPIPRLGYPPMKRPQHKFLGSYNDLSVTSSNPATKYLDTMTWSGNDTLNRRPYASEQSNRFQRQAKDNFAYWPTDSTQKKMRCKY